MTANFLYIDPGTGSMLFSLAVGIMTALVFAVRAAAVKIRFVISGGRAARVSAGKIPFVIFSDHRRYWNVFKPVCDEFERRGIPLVYYTQSPDDPALCEKYEFVRAEFIGEGNRGLVRMNMLNAGVVLSTTPGLDVLQWKRSRNVDWYVHIPHLTGDLTTYRMFGLDHYDAVCLSGEYQGHDVRRLEELRGLPEKELVVTGAPYMDWALNRVRALPFHKTDTANPTVLVAPSWGESAILTKFGERLLDALVRTEFKIIVRPHPQSKTAEKELLEKLERRYAHSGNLVWNFDNDNLAVMNCADILITDFSGIIFDWSLLFDRPLIYADTEFVSDPYDAAWLNEPLWTFRVLPEIGIRLEEKNFGGIRRIILDALKSTELSAARDLVREQCWQNRGNAAEAVVDYVTERK